MANKPWVSGPKELLDHGEGHLKSRTAFDCRIAIISIDNAVELAIRTYLGLPVRARGTQGPSRKDLETATGFPDLLDLLEKYGGDRLSGVELGDLEWYHRLRNTLYHDGNGVTVDPDKVDAYNQIARLLFNNLFEPSPNEVSEAPASTLLGELVMKWATLEARVDRLAREYLPRHARGIRTTVSLFDGLIAKSVVPSTLRRRVEELYRARNSVVHSPATTDTSQLKGLLATIDDILAAIPGE